MRFGTAILSGSLAVIIGIVGVTSVAVPFAPWRAMT